MIVTHLHHKLNLLRRTKSHSNSFMLSIFQKTKSWCNFLSTIFYKTGNHCNFLVTVTCNIKGHCNLLQNKLHMWIKLK
jgi:hypothetical protein